MQVAFVLCRCPHSKCDCAKGVAPVHCMQSYVVYLVGCSLHLLTVRIVSFKWQMSIAFTTFDFDRFQSHVLIYKCAFFWLFFFLLLLNHNSPFPAHQIYSVLIAQDGTRCFLFLKF